MTRQALPSIRLHGRAAFAVLIAVVAVLAAEPALARRLGGVPQVDLLRLDGRLGPPRPEDKGTEDLTLQDGKDELHFQLTDLRVMNSGRLAGDVLFAVRPYRPNFYLRGPKELIQKLRAAGPNDTVRILGYRRSRELMVSQVEVGPAGTPSPAH